jgi:hypothetical protein
MPVGYPGDSDPRDEEPEWECVRCGGVVVNIGPETAECLDCKMIFENDEDFTE